jgi:hypothetical protein
MTWISNYLRSHRVPGSIVFYAFYLVIAALALFVGLVIWRQSLLVLIYGLLANDDVARLVYVAAMLVLSLGLLGGIMACDPYLHAGIKRGDLARRALTIVAVLAGATLIGLLLPSIVPT